MALRKKEKKEGESQAFLAKALLVFATLNFLVFALIMQLKPEQKTQLYTKKMYNLGVNLQKEGRTDLAAKYFNRILDEYPQTIYADRALYNLANIKLRLEFNYDEAIASYKRLLKEYPDSHLAHKAESNIKFLESHRDFNDQPLTLFYQAGAFKRNKQFKEAIDTLKMITRDYPDSKMNMTALYWTGKLLDDVIGNQDEAFRTYRALCQKYPKSKRAKDVYPILQQMGIEIDEMK